MIYLTTVTRGAYRSSAFQDALSIAAKGIRYELNGMLHEVHCGKPSDLEAPVVIYAIPDVYPSAPAEGGQFTPFPTSGALEAMEAAA